MERARRAASSFVLLALIASCSIVESYDSETNQVCPAGSKACNAKCVTLNDPSTGCSGPTCSPCDLPNVVTAGCDANGCTVASCTNGFDNCDGNPSNGCEANLNDDVYNCASCGRGCARAHTAGVCVNGTCAIGTCDPGFADCNASYNDGCEAELATDPQACGSCGNACAAGRRCIQSQCLEASRVVSGPASRHACAILSDNSLRCWGSDEFGQVGDNATCSGPSCVAASAVAVKGNLADVAAVATGESHTCAVTRGGLVYCWGSNVFGQLGLGTADTTAHAIPVALPAFTSGRVTALTAGARHTCAQTADGAVWCWGDDAKGQVGAAGGASAYPAPALVAGGDAGVLTVSLAAGATHTCAARGDGLVYCWGDDSAGQLGDNGAATGSCGGSPCALTPVAMSTINDGVSVACGGDFTCVIRHADFSEWCAGSGALGQLGNGGTSSPVPVPLSKVGGLSALSSPQAGGGHACSLLASNATLWCWGDNGRDQLFAGSPADLLVPTPIGATKDVVQVALGLDFSCVMTAGAVVRCVGDNTLAQLGVGAADTAPHPTLSAVSGLP